MENNTKTDLINEYVSKFIQFALGMLDKAAIEQQQLADKKYLSGKHRVSYPADSEKISLIKKVVGDYDVLLI